MDRTIDSYQCKLVSSSSTNSNRTEDETVQHADPNRQNPQKQRQVAPRFSGNNSNAVPQPANWNNQYSQFSHNESGARWNQLEPTARFPGNNHNAMQQSAYGNYEDSYPNYDNSASQWSQPQPARLSVHSSVFVPQSANAQGGYSHYNYYQTPTAQNQQQPNQSREFQARGRGRGRGHPANNN